MQYYMIEWENEEVDEPYRLYVEADDQNRVLREVEAYRAGYFQRYEPQELCADPRTLAGDEGEITYLLPWQFSDLWNGTPDMPSALEMNLW